MKMQDPIKLDPAGIVRLDLHAYTDDELRAICRKLDFDAEAMFEVRQEWAILFLIHADRMLVAACHTPDPRAIFFDDAYYPMPRSVRDAIVAIPAAVPPEPDPPQDMDQFWESVFEAMGYELDLILDKISVSGIDSLDEWELAFLERRYRPA